MTTSNIGIIGVGGVGGYFGGKLCRLQDDGRSKVWFIARGEHLRAVQASGLQLNTESDGEITCRPFAARDDLSELPKLHLCLVCVKVFDLRDALVQLRHAIDHHTVVIPLLNGVDIQARIREVIEQGIVLPACVYVGTHIDGRGCVIQKGGACKILFGPDPQRPGFAADNIVQAFDRAGIKSEWTTNIQSEIWQKYVFICAFGMVSAAHDRTLGQILDDEGLRGDVAAIMSEIVSLARSTGISLPDDIVTVSMAKGQSFPHDAKTSFQRDFERLDRQDERDLFAGTMRRMSDRFGVTMPRTSETASFLAKRKPFLTTRLD